MTLDQLEASILALPVPTTAAEWPAYRQACRDLEAEYSASIMRPLDLDELDALAEETRPPGMPFDGESWDTHLARLESIEAAYAR
jgi:hypothetical protein